MTVSFSDSVHALVTFPFLLFVLSLKFWSFCPLLFHWNFPLSEVPGPRLASWTRLWWIKTLYSRKVEKELVGIVEQYGPIVRISPRTVIIADPETTRRVLAIGEEYTRGPWFDSLRLDPDHTTVVSEKNPKRHQELRGILSAGLSGKDLPVEHIIDAHIRSWFQLLNLKYVNSTGSAATLNLSLHIPYLTFDIITDLCLGESFDCIENEHDEYGFLDALQKGMVAQGYISSLLELKTLLFWIGRLGWIRERLFPNVRNKNGIGRVMGEIYKVVENRLSSRQNSGHKMNDMLDSFLSRGMTLEQATSELVVVLSSGIGSVSYTLQATIYCIVSHPAVYRKLISEIDDAFAKSGPEIKDSYIKEMPFLQACISESLRVHPPISQLRERVVPHEGDFLNGYRIPGGTFVGLNMLAGQIHPAYGEKPKEYRPERWLITDKAQLKQMHRNLDLVFGYGSCRCLGVNLAYMELNKIVFELFRNFDITFGNLESSWKKRGDMILSDFSVKIKRRE